MKPILKGIQTKSERETLKNVKQRNDIIIIKAGNRVEVVVTNVEDYIKLSNKQ